MSSGSTPTSAPRKRGRRAWWIAGACVLVLLLGIYFIMPLIIANRLEARLEARFETDVQLRDVDVSLLGPSVAVEGVEFTFRENVDVELPRVAVDWSWTKIIGGVPPNVRIVAPHLRVRIDPQQPPESFERKSLSLSGFRSLHVEDGAVTVELQTLYEPVEIEFADIQARMHNTALPSDDLTTQLEASASVGPTGELRVEGSLIPSDPRSGWALEFALENVDVVPLNPLWNSIVEMDTSEGAVSLRGRLSVSKGRLRGRIEPNFTNLRMIDPDEPARHPMGEALFSEMLSGADNAMIIDAPAGDGGGTSLAQLMATDWESVIEGVIQRGYQRQLDTLIGYESEIGAVEVDFGAGRLLLRDVSITRDTGLVEVPFIYVAELDVRFDESVPNADVDSYKHVVMRRPVLSFVAHEDEKRRQMQFDPDWPTKISTLPFQTADLRVEDGMIRFVEHRGGAVHEIAVHDVQLVGEQMARDLSPPGERRATIKGSGMALGEAMVRVSVAYEPASEKGNTHFEFELQPLPVEHLNPLARTHADIDASDGTIGVAAMFDSEQGVVTAEVTLDLEGVRLLGETEESVEHPVREFLLTSRLKKLDGRQLRTEFERNYDSGLFSQVGMALLRQALDG